MKFQTMGWGIVLGVLVSLPLQGVEGAGSSTGQRDAAWLIGNVQANLANLKTRVEARTDKQWTPEDVIFEFRQVFGGKVTNELLGLSIDSRGKKFFNSRLVKFKQVASSHSWFRGHDEYYIDSNELATSLADISKNIEMYLSKPLARGDAEKAYEEMMSSQTDYEIHQGREAEAGFNRRDRHDMALTGSMVFAFCVPIYYLCSYGIPGLFSKRPPSVVNETSIQTRWEKILGAMGMGKKLKKQPSRRADIIFAPGLDAKLKRIESVMAEAVKSKQELDNLLLFGPPGTGKSVFAKELARQSKVHFVFTSGANFLQLPIQEALSELKHMIDWAHSESDKPVMIFIDEADSMFPPRDRASEDCRRLTTMFLALVATPSNKKVMFVFATNDPHSLDAAVLNRFGKHGRIHLPAPGPEERVKLLNLYFRKHILQSGLTAGPGVIKLLPKIAERLEGWVGRDFEQAMVDFHKYLQYEERRTVTPKTLMEFLNEGIFNQNALSQFRYIASGGKEGESVLSEASEGSQEELEDLGS